MFDSRLRGACTILYLGVFFLAGCGRDNPLGRVALSGTVTFQGKPLDRGTIEFTPLPGSAGVGSGAIIQDGSFDVSADQGLPPGTYRVRIYSAESGSGAAAPEAPGEHESIAKERIPPEFNSQSTQEVNVTSDGPNTFEFNIP